MTKTKMTKKQSLEAICLFAHDYIRDPKKSPIIVYNETNYSDRREKISFEQVKDFVEKNPKVIKHWIQYTEDKRYTPAWGVRKVTINLWEIFYMGEEGKDIEYKFKFNNASNACAFMILQEMEEFHFRHKQ